MNILYEYVLLCKVVIHHEHGAITLSESAPLTQVRGTFTAELDDFNETIKRRDGWTDGGNTEWRG